MMMRLTGSASSISLSYLVFLVLTCLVLFSGAAPLALPSTPSTLHEPWSTLTDALTSLPNVHRIDDARFLSKRSNFISLGAGSGWTMTFAPYGMFLPLQSMFLILESFYQGALGRAIGAEVAGLPAQAVIKFIMGDLGKRSKSRSFSLHCAGRLCMRVFVGPNAMIGQQSVVICVCFSQPSVPISPRKRSIANVAVWNRRA